MLDDLSPPRTTSFISHGKFCCCVRVSLVSCWNVLGGWRMFPPLPQPPLPLLSRREKLILLHMFSGQKYDMNKMCNCFLASLTHYVADPDLVESFCRAGF